MNAFLAKKSSSWYVSCVSLVLALVGLLIYVIRGGNTYSPVSSTAVTLWVLGLVSNAVILWNDFRIGQFVPFILYCVTLGVLVNSEMLFASNVLVSIDGGFFDAGWIVFVALLFLAVITGLVAAAKPLNKE